MASNSKRHHFLPVFYINGFRNNRKQLFIYNKVTNEITSKNSKQVFFEWNRNNVLVQGEENDFLEKLHGWSESKFAPIYKEMISELNFSLFNKLYLIFFISEIHNRNPNLDYKREEYIGRFIKKDSILRLKDKNGFEIENELNEMVADLKEFKKSISIVKGIEDYLKYSSEVNNLIVTSIPKSCEKNYLLSDYPIITERDTDDLFESRFIFTLSNGIRVYYTKGSKIKKIPPEHQIDVDVLSWLISRKSIGGTNKDYLKSISELGRSYANQGSISFLRMKVFSVMD